VFEETLPCIQEAKGFFVFEKMSVRKVAENVHRLVGNYRKKEMVVAGL
jgi:hypothetical protein